jgi:hypothetical protein
LLVSREPDRQLGFWERFFVPVLDGGLGGRG